MFCTLGKSAPASIRMTRKTTHQPDCRCYISRRASGDPFNSSSEALASLQIGGVEALRKPAVDFASSTSSGTRRRESGHSRQAANAA